LAHDIASAEFSCGATPALTAEQHNNVALAIVAVAPLTEPRAQLFARAGTRDAAGVFYSFVSHVDAHNSLL